MALPPFQQLVDAHWRDVARLARALAGPIDGDDVAQQAWLQAYAAYPSLRSATNLRGWLLTITHRCAADVHRARARRATPTTDDVLVAHGPPVAGPESIDPIDPQLWQRIWRLPDRQREALVLRYWAGHTFREIAEIMDCPLPTAQSRVRLGYQQLRAALREEKA